jgi:hypothetical protein
MLQSFLIFRNFFPFALFYGLLSFAEYDHGGKANLSSVTKQKSKVKARRTGRISHLVPIFL